MSEQPRKVLVVIDDEPAILEFVADGLRDAGYVVYPTGPSEAKAVLTARQPDVVCTDLQMPGWDGSEVAAWVRARLPGARVVVYSAQPATGVFAGLARELGAHAMVTKPFDLADLIRAIEGP